jgi:PAS domain S-box-containing protein
MAVASRVMNQAPLWRNLCILLPATLLGIAVFDLTRRALTPTLGAWTAYELTIGLGAGIAAVVGCIALRRMDSVRESKLRLRRLVEQLPAAAVFIEGRHIHLNRGAETATGYHDGALSTLDDWFRALYGDRHERVRDLYEAERRVGFPYATTVPIRCKDGEHRFRERDFAESLFETAHAIVLILDPQGRIVRFNSFMQELSGYSLEEVRGKDWFETFLPERDRARIHEVFRSAAADIAVRGNVNPILTKDGAEREVVWWAKTLKDARGMVVGVMSIGHDITELRDAQQKLVQSERLAAIGEAMTGLAHESRNALQRIQACSEMLALEVDDHPPALDLVERIQKAQSHLHQLYEEVRGYAAPGTRQRQPCDVARLWRETWSELQQSQNGAAVRLREEAATDCQCRVDARAIQQVLRNIFENSIAAVGNPGEVLLHCTAHKLDGQSALRLAVRDNGPGLSREQNQRIFDPFYTTKTQGTGLGMAIARRIVEAHGGRIAVGEPPNGGTEIVVTLPRGMP